MRIASFYPSLQEVGRNDGPPLFHTYNLRKLFGEENVVHLSPKGNINDFGKFDLYYWVDFGDDAVNIGTYWTCPKPNVYISSDTHLGYEYRLEKAREFDFVFCNQRRARTEFIRDGIPHDKCFWLPHAFEPDAYYPHSIIKKYDVCFIGYLNSEGRVVALDKLFKAIPNFYWGIKFFEEAAKIYSQSKIVFNISIKDDLNMRVFETLGSGAFLLTNRTPDIEELFVDGKHLVLYDTVDEAIDKAKYYSEHDAEREAIAKSGYEEAIAKHTYAHRIKKIFETINVAQAELVAL